MRSPATASPVHPACQTSGVLLPLATLALAAAVVGTLLLPSVSHAQSCYCPDGMDSEGNPVTSTTCGEQVCGADFHWYSCQEGGWNFEGGSCGTPPTSCSCTGTDSQGNPVTVNTCGEQVCGADFQYYTCENTGWTTQAVPCQEEEEPPPSCFCPDGVDYLGNPIVATTCGEQVCGADFQYYTCGQTGWHAQGTSCPEEGPIAGVPLPTLTPLDVGLINATLGFDPTAWGISQAALQSEIALSNVRVRFGRAQYVYQSLPPTATEQRADAERAMSAQYTEMQSVLQGQAALSVDQVERARLPVLITRLSQLEKQYAHLPGYAVQLARQAYYNGAMYWAASGAAEIPTGLIALTGVPHGPIHPDENGGYIADIRAPNGERVDFGHLLCAVDFNAPYPRVGSSETYWRNPVTYGFTELPNLANHGGMVTLAGDLGTAANYLREEGVDGWTALMNEGHEDMRGDVDGLNVSMLVNRHGWPGETPVASTLIDYYYGSSTDTYTGRASLFIYTSSYTLDLRGIGLGYQLLDYLPSDVAKVAVVFSYMGEDHDADGTLGTPEVVFAFKEWLDRELAGTNPIN